MNIKEIEYKAALAGEIGKAKLGTKDRHDLKAWTIGATIKFNEISLAASYSDWGRSGVVKADIINKKFGGKHWTAGMAYEKGNFGISLTNLKSVRANSFNIKSCDSVTQYDNGYNKFLLTSIGVDYKLLPGMLIYSEVSFFQSKFTGWYASNKGNVIIMGTKLVF